MQTERILVANVKCGGCASTIKDGLRGLPGVEAVDVNIADGAVTVDISDTDSLSAVRDKLAELGYPAR
jgi:copper chaperone CopZ